MKKWLHNKKGVTVLEGVIALGLLAIITAGSFGVLLATSRQAIQPDMREEMALAVEKANDKLKAYLVFVADSAKAELLPTSLRNGLCGGDTTPFQLSVPHSISCMLPPICDPNNSSFSYQISQAARTQTIPESLHKDLTPVPTGYQIAYTISCNGYQL